MNLSLVHFMSALGSSAALGPSAANLLTPKFSRNTARAHMNVKLMDTAIPIRKLQGDDILGVRGVGIVRTAAIGGVGIDTNAMANVADGVVGDGVRGVGGIAVGGSVRGVGISSLPGISSVLLPEGGGGSRNKISVRAHEFVFIFSLSCSLHHIPSQLIMPCSYSRSLSLELEGMIVVLSWASSRQKVPRRKAKRLPTRQD